MRCALFAAVTMGALAGYLPRVATAQALPTDAPLIRALEDSLWTTSRERRVEAFASYLAPDYRGVYPDGVHDKARELATFPEVHIISYEFQDFVGRPLGPGVYGVTYRTTVRGTFKEFRLDGDYWCASVWQHSNGKWVAILHTEAKVQ
jgi:hypothetical protein